MREHIGLYRGKRKDNGEWVQGTPFFACDCCKMIVAMAVHPDFVDEGNVYYAEGYPVDPDTVGECAGGLTDKNGTLIFEGDILRIFQASNGIGDYWFPPVEYPVKVIVCWDMCAWLWKTIAKDKRYISFPSAWCHFECEVIGNIHDNPELLGGGDDD